MSVKFIGLAVQTKNDSQEWHRDFNTDDVVREFVKFFESREELRRFILSGRVREVKVLNPVTKEYDIGFYRRIQTLVLSN